MESSGRTLVCSVLFLDIAEYSKKPVAEQLQLKQAFNAFLSKALAQVPQRDRIILDTGDGAAVTFMGDPEDALFSAMTVRDLAGPVPVRLGVNLGPVRLVKDLNGQMNIIGDGINVAQRVMGFAEPGQLLVSRSFFEVVSCLSRDYMNLFRHEGSRTDKHVREHEVYSVGETPFTPRQSAPQASMRQTASRWVAGMGPLGLRRSALVAAPAVFLVLVGSGITARAMIDRGEPAAPPADRPTTALVAPGAKSAGAGKTDARSDNKMAEGQLAPPTAGRVELAIAPWGEVLVNGSSRGVSPPLRVLEIPPGQTTIEIRNSNFPAHIERLDVKAGEAVKIRHRFR